MTMINGCPGGDKAVGKTAEEGIPGGRRGSSYWKSDKVAGDSSNKSLQTTRRKGYWEGVGVGKEDRSDR